MPKGMLQALLGLAPNSQMWTPSDLSNCIFRNTEAADSVDVLARALKNMGTEADPASYNPESAPAAGPELAHTFPRMRTLHESRRDEEHWLVIPEGATYRQCLTHVPRHSWKLMVEFFLALKTNIGSWIQNLERRDMMLLGALAENIFGFRVRDICQKETSMFRPDPYGMDTMDGVQYHK